MNTPTRIKHKSFLLLILILFSFFFSSCEKQKEFDYPLIETDYAIEIFLPKYVPDGYKVKEIDITDIYASIIYTSDTGDISFLQIATSNNSVSLDTEKSIITEYNSDKFSGYLLTDKYIESQRLLYVYNDTNSFAIDGLLEESEIIKMIESIEKYEP